MILIEVDPVRAIQNPRTFTIEIASYDPDNHHFTMNSFHGWATIDGLAVGNAPPRLAARRVKPGVYGLLAVRAGPWGACYNGGTVYFEVKPGVATYVGRLDPEPSFQTIAQKVASGEMPKTFSSNYLVYTYDIAPPMIFPPAGDLDAVTRQAAAENPGLTAPIVAAALLPTTFNTGHMGFSSLRLCGGYGPASTSAPPSPVPVIGTASAPPGTQFAPQTPGPISTTITRF